MAAIEVVDIKKRYGGVEALKGVSLTVNQGEIFGLIGPDGAGKTTLFRILATLILADAGSAAVEGHDVRTELRAIRSIVGYMPGRFSLYQDLSVRENLQFFATLFGTTIAKNYELIRPIYSQIEAFANRRAGALSGGMKQKLALSCALIHSPKLLLLDEPTTGVDPVSRKEFWEMLHSLKEQGMTIVVSTPYLDEVRQCDRMAFLQEGRVILDRFEPSVVFSEAGLNRDESAVLPFLGLVRRRASRARALDAEEVFGRSDRRFTPTRFEGGLG